MKKDPKDHYSMICRSTNYLLLSLVKPSIRDFPSRLLLFGENMGVEGHNSGFFNLKETIQGQARKHGMIGCIEFIYMI